MNKSFTLLELLIVIAIIAVLSTVVIFALDPGEMMAKARDTKRLTDLTQLEKAIIVYLSEGNKTLPSTTTNSLSGNTNINGTGWLPIDFTSSTLGSSIPSLPIDPKNNNNYYYNFISDGNYFEINCRLESKTYKDKTANDGGNVDSVYEVGTSLTVSTSLVYDDFEDASIDTNKWQQAPTGNTTGDWTETGGYIQAQVTGSNSWRGWGIATKNTYNLTGNITWMINRSYLDGNFGNFFIADVDDAKWSYNILDYPNWGFGFLKGDNGDNLIKIVNGTETILENFSAYRTTLGKFEIKKIGTTYSVWLNDSKISNEYNIPELENKNLYMVWDVCRTNNANVYTVRVIEAKITSY